MEWLPIISALMVTLGVGLINPSILYFRDKRIKHKQLISERLEDFDQYPNLYDLDYLIDRFIYRFRELPEKIILGNDMFFFTFREIKAIPKQFEYRSIPVVIKNLGYYVELK